MISSEGEPWGIQVKTCALSVTMRSRKTNVMEPAPIASPCLIVLLCFASGGSPSDALSFFSTFVHNRIGIVIITIVCKNIMELLMIAAV